MDEKKREAFEELLALGDDLEFERLDLGKLNAVTPGITWSGFGGACPLQGDGVYDATGEDVYFRYRHDTARLEVGSFPKTDADYKAGKPWSTRLHSVQGGVVGNQWSGDLSFDELEPVLIRLQSELEVARPGETYSERLAAAVNDLARAHSTKEETQ